MVRRLAARGKFEREVVCANVFGLQWSSMLLALMSCARVSVHINRAAVGNRYVQQVLRHAIVTVLSSLVIPPQTLVGNLVVNHE